MSARIWIYLGVGILAGVVAGAWGIVAWLKYEPPNYSEIEADLFVGGSVDAPPPGTEAVLNVCEHRDPYATTVESFQPIRDAEPAPSLEWLRKQVRFIDEQRAAGRRTYVHCQHGQSRSVMVLIAWLMARHHWTRAEAQDLIKSKRKDVAPNPVFDELLAEWEREVLGQAESERSPAS